MKLVFLILLGLAAFFWLCMGPDETDAAQRLADTVIDRQVEILEIKFQEAQAKVCLHRPALCKE